MRENWRGYAFFVVAIILLPLTLAGLASDAILKALSDWADRSDS